MDRKQLRRDMKRMARQNMKQHYAVFMFACLIVAFLGVEFTSSLDFVKVGQEHFEAISSFFSHFGEKGFVANSRGVFSMAIRRFSSGSLIDMVAGMLINLYEAGDIPLFLGILVSSVAAFILWVFVMSVSRVVITRIFLEGRVYSDVGLHRMAFLSQVHRWKKASLSMVRVRLQLLPWMLTVVGYPVMAYAYCLAPFILAENPDLSGGEALKLSRRMMKGHKWERFVLALSFILWDLLAAVTLGLSDLFFGNSYWMATFTEFYARLREEAIATGIEGSDLLCDSYLYRKADPAKLAEVYPDAAAREARPITRTYKNGVERFFGEVFGLTLWPSQREMEIEREQMRLLNERRLRACAEGNAYPMRLCPIPASEKKLREPLIYARRYSLFSVVLIFFCFSIVGWTWEVGMHLATDGEFVNRGVLHGPWLPIYGTGGVMALLLLYRERRNPALQFLLTMVLAGCVEYFTAYWLEMTHGGARWWDYGGYFLNLQGRICAEGLLIFGMGGLAAVYFVAPALDNLFRRMKRPALALLCAMLLGLFAADEVYSAAHPNEGTGITSITDADAVYEDASPGDIA